MDVAGGYRHTVQSHTKAEKESPHTFLEGGAETWEANRVASVPLLALLPSFENVSASPTDFREDELFTLPLGFREYEVFTLPGFSGDEIITPLPGFSRD